MAEDAPLDLNEELVGCARFGELEDVLAIITEGGRVEYTDASGSSPLHYAAANGHLGVVQALIERGARMTANNNGNTPLHWAALNGHSGIVKVLLELPVEDILAKNSFGKSALTEALMGGHEDIARLILSHPSIGESAATASTNSSQATGSAAGEPDDADLGAPGTGTRRGGIEELDADTSEDDADIFASATREGDGVDAGATSIAPPIITGEQ